MNSVGGFFLGVIIGGGISSALTNLFLREKYEKLANEDIESIRIHKEEQLQKILDDILNTEEDKRLDKINELKEKYGRKEKKLTENNDKYTVMSGKSFKPGVRKTSYNSYCTDKGPERETNYDISSDPGGPPEGDDSDTYVATRDETLSYEIHKKGNDIELIDAITFGNTDICDSEEYYYYSGNDIVTDAFDKEVEDWEDYLGNSWVEELISNKEGVVYIRNNRISMKYSVTMIEGDYEPIE